MMKLLKKYWGRTLVVVFGLGVALAAGTTPTVTTIPSRSITGDFFSPSVTVPAGNTVTIQATMTDAVFHDTTKAFVMTFQYSLDGTNWRDDVGCGWSGIATDTTSPTGEINTRPYCSTDISTLTGKQMRLHVQGQITMGATITIQ